MAPRAENDLETGNSIQGRMDEVASVIGSQRQPWNGLRCRGTGQDSAEKNEPGLGRSGTIGTSFIVFRSIFITRPSTGLRESEA